MLLLNAIKLEDFLNLYHWHTFHTMLSVLSGRCSFSFVSLKSELEKIAPTWMNVSLNMKEDPETDKAFGWVLEM